ncbi:hypothetical protein LX32DRAFT_344325 [Colletotrichum zoysiae]|uniref:Uncharacterized protein n=1 Tax=Colletotrichum zoysiae TaxID=1216348 RepID=A0AAD9HIQ0_9PEZI|nr:hypothetical protein LX32DRAFT_344325 [Colletotrichum zoysiae]
MLLQAAGLLDIDKMIEHREPEERVGLWLRPRAPQLMVDQTDGSRHQINCDKSLQPHMFCETCARGLKNDDYNPENARRMLEIRVDHCPENLRKIHKNCILSTCTPIPSEEEQGLCQCSSDSESPTKPLLPSDKNDRGYHDPKCHLVKLKSQYYRSKLRELERLEMSRQSKNQSFGEAVRSATTKVAVDAINVHNNIPYGNVHMSLMVGPLVIENGVLQSKRGVLFTIRDRLQLRPVGTTTVSPL